MGRIAGTDQSFNANSKYRTYSYHHILIACAHGGVAEALSTTSNDLSLFSEGSRSGALRGGSAGGGEYFILVNGMKDAHFVIKSASWLSMKNPNTSSPYGPTEPGGAISAIEGEIVIEEPGGIDLLNVFSEITTTLMTRPVEQTYLLKTVFVGHTTDGNTVVDSSVAPIFFAALDIEVDIKSSGVVYLIKCGGIVNGVGHIAQYADGNRGTSVTFPPGTTLKAGFEMLTATVNKENERKRQKTLEDTRNDSGAQVLADSKVVTYKYEVSPELENLLIGSNSKVNEKDKTGGVTLTAAGEESVTSFVHRVGMTAVEVTGREPDPNAQEKSPAAKKVPHKSSQTATPAEIAAGKPAGKPTGDTKPSSPNAGVDSTKENTQQYLKVHTVRRSTAEGTEIVYFLSTEDAGVNKDCALSPAPEDTIEFDYIFTGKNVDIRDLDLKLSLGAAFFQTRRASHAFPDQERSNAGTVTDQVAGGGSTSFSAGALPCGTTLSRSEFPAVVTSGNSAVAAGPTMDYFSDLSKFIGMNRINLKMTIIGHPVLMAESVASPEEHLRILRLPKGDRAAAIAAPNGTRVPKFAKVNIKYPSKGANYADLRLIYDGVYHILNINNIFDGGEFTQELDLMAVLDGSPLTPSSVAAPGKDQEKLKKLRQLAGLRGQGGGGGLTEAQGAGRRASPANFGSNEEFVNAVRPAAEKAAAELGVDPNVLIAQAAVESGWGKRPIKKADGSNGFNIFGIKADRSWKGERNTVGTHEVRGGARVSEQGSFRVYNSYDESFADYVNFIKTNPRYRPALAHGGDSTHYIRGLQTAGYATDPNYANVILSTANGRTLKRAAVLAQNTPPSQATSEQLASSSTKTAAAMDAKSTGSTDAKKITGEEKLALKSNPSTTISALDEKMGV